MQIVSAYVQNIAIFLILTSFISIIMPQKRFKQYIDLCLGIIFIFLVTSPLSGILSAITGGGQNIFADIELSYNRAVIQAQIDAADEVSRERIVADFEAGLKAQLDRLIETQGYSVVFADFDIDATAENFGRILSLELVVSQEAAGGIPFISIDPIRITPSINTRGETPYAPDFEDNGHILSIKSIISDFYNLDMDNIMLEIIGNH